MQLARAEQVGAPTVAPVTASTPVPEPAAAPQPASLPAAASAARSRSRTESLDKSSAPQASVTSVRRSSGGGGSMFGFGSSVAARPSDAGETSNRKWHLRITCTLGSTIVSVHVRIVF